MPPRPRRNRPSSQGELKEVARLADRLQAVGYTTRDVVRIIDRDPSLATVLPRPRPDLGPPPALVLLTSSPPTPNRPGPPPLEQQHHRNRNYLTSNEAH
ncbi:hypothetical protein ACWDA7_30150 [Streptomyces sp. NPDC001156]